MWNIISRADLNLINKHKIKKFKTKKIDQEVSLGYFY